jgi:hypothetical protein
MGAIATYDWIGPADRGTNKIAATINAALLMAYKIGNSPMKTLGLAFGGTLEAPSGHRSTTPPAADYTSDMLQRTTEAPTWPDRIDYLVVERIARDIRNQYIAGLISRAKKALADRFARGGPPSIGPAR